MKRFRTLLLALIGALALSFGVFALAACSKSDPSGTNPPVEISAEYKAIYDNYYKTAAGEGAKTLEDWYADLTADIEEIDIDGEIASLDVESINDVDYIVVTYDGGRQFVEELLDGDGFKEAVTFTIAPTNSEGESITSGIYLDITLEGGDKVATVNVTSRGTEDLMLIGESTSEYEITVNEKSSGSYGFAMGYEPHFAMADEEHTVEFAVQAASEMVTHTVTVECRAEGEYPLEDIELALTYAEGDAAEGIIIDKQSTDENGQVTFTFYAHEGSDYVVELNNSTLTPETFIEPTEPFALDLASPTGSTVTLERLKHYDPENAVKATTTPTQAEDFDRRDVLTISLSSANVAKVQKQDENTYNYNDSSVTNRRLYVALDMVIPGINAEKSIKGLLEEDEDYFTCEHLISEDDNTWQVYKYKEMLQAYMPYLNEKGLYPLNDDLYNFINDTYIQKLYATQSDYALLLPLVYYSDDKLAVGGAYEDYTLNLTGCTNQPYCWKTGRTGSKYNFDYLGIGTATLLGSTDAGWYVLSVKTTSFADSAKMSVFLNGVNGFVQATATKEFNSSTFNITKVTEGVETPYYEGKAVIYLPGNVTTLTIVHDHSQATTVNVKIEKVDGYTEYAALKDYGRPFIKNGEMEVLVYPESWLKGTSAATGVNYENWTTFGYTLDLNRLNVKYTITPTITEELTGVKVHRLTRSDNKTISYYNDASLSNGVGINATTLTNNEVISSARYVFAFSHSGTEIKKMTINVSATYTKMVATYKPGDGAEGADYTPVTGASVGANYTLLGISSMKFTKQGYTFCGWSYTDDEEVTTVYLPGQTLVVPDHDFVLTALWKKDAENVSADALSAGSPVSLQINGELYTTNIVRFADGVTSDKAYMLTLTTEEEWGGWLIELGGKTVTLMEISADSGHKYVTFIARGEGVDGLVIYTPYKDAPQNATFSLEEYSPLSVTADGETEYIIPFAPGDVENLPPMEMKVGEGSFTAGHDYKFSFVDASVKDSVGYIQLIADVMPDGATYLGRAFTIPTGTAINITLEADATKLYLVNAGMAGLYPTVYGAAKIKIAREYSISYEIGEAGENGGSGSVANENYKAAGDSVTLSDGSGFVWDDIHVFVYWVKKGDVSEKPYYGGSQFVMPGEDVTFIAKWRTAKIESLAFSAPVSGSYTDEQDTEINFDDDTSFSLQVTDMISFRTGLYFVFDLGASDYAGEIVLNLAPNLDNPGNPKVRNVVLTHSDLLSSDGHNVFTGYDRTYDGNISYMSYTLDLKAWAAAGNPVIKNIKVKLTVPSYYLNGEDKDGNIAGNIAIKNTTYISSDTEHQGPYFPSDVFNGGTYKLHIKFHSDAGNVTNVSLYRYLGFGKSPATEDYKLTADENDPNHYISDEFVLTTETRSLKISTRSSKGYYTADVWAEKIKDADAVSGEKLSLTQAANIKVTKDSPVTVALDDTSVNPGLAYNINVTEGADVKLQIATSLSSTRVATYTPDASNRYTIRNITFGERTFTVSTTSEQEQDISLTLLKYEVVNLTASEDGNMISLPASPADSDVIMSSGRGTGYFKMAISGKDGALEEGVVIKLKSDSNVYTFDKNNNWTIEIVSISSNAMVMWTEGAAVEIKATLTEWQNVIKNTGSSNGANVDMRGDETTFEADYVLVPTVFKNVGWKEYQFVIRFKTMSSQPTADTMTCTLTIGEKTVNFPKPKVKNGYWYSENCLEAKDIGPYGAIVHLKIVDNPRTNSVSSVDAVQIYVQEYADGDIGSNKTSTTAKFDKDAIDKELYGKISASSSIYNNHDYTITMKVSVLDASQQVKKDIDLSDFSFKILGDDYDGNGKKPDIEIKGFTQVMDSDSPTGVYQVSMAFNFPSYQFRFIMSGVTVGEGETLVIETSYA